MNRSVRLVFFGTEDFSVPSLESLIQAGWSVVAVITKPDSRSGRGQKLNLPQVKRIAQANGIKVLQPEKLQRTEKEIAALKPTHGLLAAYGKIIPQSILDLFPGGIINVHPSLLPKYRGPSPVEAAILNGDEQTGISLIRLTAGMDEGPVYARKEIDVPFDIDAPLFSRLLAKAGADFLKEKLPDIIDGSLTPKPQKNSDATYTKLLKKADGQVDWSKTAAVLEREVRAYLGFPRSTTKINGHDVIITKARIAEGKGDGSFVMAANPGYLEIQELIAPSGRRISGADFLRGYKS